MEKYYKYFGGWEFSLGQALDLVGECWTVLREVGLEIRSKNPSNEGVVREMPEIGLLVLHPRKEFGEDFLLADRLEKAKAFSSCTLKSKYRTLARPCESTRTPNNSKSCRE